MCSDIVESEIWNIEYCKIVYISQVRKIMHVNMNERVAIPKCSCVLNWDLLKSTSSIVGRNLKHNFFSYQNMYVVTWSMRIWKEVVWHTPLEEGLKKTTHIQDSTFLDFSLNQIPPEWKSDTLPPCWYVWLMSALVFWVVTLCRLVGGYQFQKNILFPYSRLKTGAVCSSEPWVPTYKSI
jgi:hypothetical protein